MGRAELRRQARLMAKQSNANLRNQQRVLNFLQEAEVLKKQGLIRAKPTLFQKVKNFFKRERPLP